MDIKTVIKEIRQTHSYQVSGPYWGRVGKMVKDYGAEIVLEAVKNTESLEIPLDNFLNIITVKCQHLISEGELSELDNELMNAME